MIECDDDFELNLSFGGNNGSSARKKPKEAPSRTPRSGLPKEKVMLRRDVNTSSASSSSKKSCSERSCSAPEKHAPFVKSLRRVPDSSTGGKLNTTTGLVQHKVPVIGNKVKSVVPTNASTKSKSKKTSAGPGTDDPISSLAVVPAVKTKRDKDSERRVLDDPMQYHARPKDLSKDAGSIKAVSRSEYIFTRQSFTALKMPVKVVELLEKDFSAGKCGAKTEPLFDLPLVPSYLTLLNIFFFPYPGGFSLLTATRVQSAVIPALMEQKQNILMKSETGSGKTLAYLLPMLADLLSLQPAVSRTQGTYAIILAPTRYTEPAIIFFKYC